MMPGEDGWEILKEIKGAEKTKNILVAMFTVRASREDMTKSLEYDADAHINKPFDIGELLDQVKSLLLKNASV
ncbi:MAG: two-component system response regulator, partial [Candidatus Hydrothermarchaeales archaeon]